MQTWYIISTTRYSENTPEYGHGDYPKLSDKVTLRVEAETKRKAQNLAKKISPKKYSFGGVCGNQIFTTNEMIERPWIDLNGLKLEVSE
jgi:hypothetical protein